MTISLGLDRKLHPARWWALWPLPSRMCRWLVWCSHEQITLAEVILDAANSITHQSYDAGYHPGLTSKNNMRLNADGFGMGWYGKRGAAIYRSVAPAWNNRNLRELCGSVESHCIFAHVRAATPASVVSEENCHPFRYGNLLFQHNGHIECLSVRAFDEQYIA